MTAIKNKHNAVFDVFLQRLFSLFVQTCIAQKIDNLASFRDMKSSNYFRFYYDNDIFFDIDEGYTQGVGFEFVSHFLKKNPINYLFYQPKNAEIRYGLAIEHSSYTPNR